ncbi:MAG: hypothetical protein JNK69_05895 [Saprospiraceae bacterium]|nr:hypothetical protein [Candidatus Vicinibacter proximus]MBL7822919.1 hypothetical protein [Saprospiraceae bacterium]
MEQFQFYGKPALEIRYFDLYPSDCTQYQTGTYDPAHFMEMQSQGAVSTKSVLAKYKQNGICTHIYIGVDQSGADMTNSTNKVAAPCPPYCPPGEVIETTN